MGKHQLHHLPYAGGTDLATVDEPTKAAEENTIQLHKTGIPPTSAHSDAADAIIIAHESGRTRVKKRY